MRRTNLIEEIQELKRNLDYEREKRKETEKENIQLKKEIEILKKNLESF